MKFNTDTPPAVYLSGSGNRWRVICQGLPLSADKTTPTEALEVARKMKIQPSAYYWNEEEGIFYLRADADVFQADEAQSFTLTHSPSPAPKDTTRPLF